VVAEDGGQLGLVLKQGVNRALGQLGKASSVGAKTVKGPLPFSVSVRPAASIALARVLKDPAATAVSMMSLSAVAAGDSE